MSCDTGSDQSFTQTHTHTCTHNHTHIPLWPVCMTPSAESNWPAKILNSVFVSVHMRVNAVCVFVCLHVVRLTVFTSTLMLTDTLIWMGNRAFYHQFVWAPSGRTGCVTFACVCVYLFVRQLVRPSLSASSACFFFFIMNKFSHNALLFTVSSNHLTLLHCSSNFSA